MYHNLVRSRYNYNKRFSRGRHRGFALLATVLVIFISLSAACAVALALTTQTERVYEWSLNKGTDRLETMARSAVVSLAETDAAGTSVAGITNKTVTVDDPAVSAVYKLTFDITQQTATTLAIRCEAVDNIADSTGKKNKVVVTALYKTDLHQITRWRNND